MTNIFSKIMEKLVHKQMLKYLLENSLINENQFGFLPGISAHEAIFRIVQQIYSAMNCKRNYGFDIIRCGKGFQLY